MNRGLFITLEGGDGAGKSTLIERLDRVFTEKNIPCLRTRAPGGTALGDKIRSLLLGGECRIEGRAELFLFLADRAEHVAEVIDPALREGKVVLCDRFDDSTVAYQGAARGLDPSHVRSLCTFATGGLRPDLTLYLDIDPVIGLQRSEKKSGSKDRMESEERAFHEKIRASFLQTAAEESERIRILDGSLPPQTVFQQAVEVIDALFPSFR